MCSWKDTCVFPCETRGEKPNVPYTAYVRLERGMKRAETRAPNEVLHQPEMGIPFARFSADVFLFSANFQKPPPRLLCSRFFSVCGPVLTHVRAKNKSRIGET